MAWMRCGRSWASQGLMQCALPCLSPAWAACVDSALVLPELLPGAALVVELQDWAAL